MRTISDTYINRVKPDTVADRVFLLEQIAISLEKTMLAPHGLSIVCCRVKLFNAVYSYFYDKERHIDFHGSHGIKNYKKAAFMCKWVSRVRPFSVEQLDPKRQKTKFFFYYANLINALFCSAIFEVFTKQHSTDYFDSKLLYELHYGAPSTNMLMVAFARPWS